jgi:hypothetical protein
MASKPKTGGAKKKARPPPKKKDEKQFERFVETARTLGVDESGGTFEKAFEHISRKTSLSSKKRGR